MNSHGIESSFKKSIFLLRQQGRGFLTLKKRKGLGSRLSISLFFFFTPIKHTSYRIPYPFLKILSIIKFLCSGFFSFSCNA